ncbi:MAG: glycoside hydrolase family 76 protein [Propionibacteriaceae bacterium]|nr:glycoside hydrolase family 76 protein [Propionibacteriaceae bacterium]
MEQWDQRAASAEGWVLRRFVGRYRRLPGTLLGSTVAPVQQSGVRMIVDGTHPFHYWWQAHLLDAIVDGAWRRHRGGDIAGASGSAILGHRLLATIRLRNRGTLRNHFYDDTAWLALAVDRLASLDAHLGRRASRVSLSRTRRVLTRRLLQGRDDSGGVFWNRDRDFLNAATSGPVALHLARTGRVEEARNIVEWLCTTLLEPERGMVLDGVRRTGALVTDVYTYNQGTTVAALLALGSPEDLARAASLVRAIGNHLTWQRGGKQALVLHGVGDGGLFTGILVRYLALAALDERLTAEVRGVAAELIRVTGDFLWETRDAAQGLFTHSAGHAVHTPEPGDRTELSVQVQAWMVMEAAARLGT